MIKLGNSAFSCIDNFRLILEEFDHDESGVLIDEKRGVTEAAEKRDVLHFLEVDVKIARLGRRRVEVTGMRCSAHLSGGAVDA